MLTPGRFGLDEAQGLPCRGGDHRGRGGGVDERAGPVDEDVDDGPGAGDDAAGSGDGLAQGGDDDVDVVEDVGLLAEPGAACSEAAEGVGLVDDEDGVVFFLQFHQPGQVGGVAVHREDAFGDDEAVFVSVIGEVFFETIRLIAAVGAKIGFGGFDGVDDGGVVKAVHEDEVAFLGQGGQEGLVGGPAGGQVEGGLFAEKAGKGGL